MSVAPHYRAPSQEGVLAHPPEGEIGSLLEKNRAILRDESIQIDGTPLPQFRAQAVIEVLAAARQYLRDAGEPVPSHADGPLLMSGHQPELTHVGVLVKTFALSGLARRYGLTPLNLIQDNDTVKNTSMRMASLGKMGEHVSEQLSEPKHQHLNPADVQLLLLPYDKFEGEASFEVRPILDPEIFRGVVPRTQPITGTWGFRPILPEFWQEMLRQERRTPILGEIICSTRRSWERRWGCHNLEIPLSRLCATNAFQRFARHVLNDLPSFHAIYNECVIAYRKRHGIHSRHHPVPDLAQTGDVLEAPFWRVRKGQEKRERLLMKPGHMPDLTGLRSRALTTTMFLRLCLSDSFIHGIGGAKYDEVTDAILKRWLGIEAPGFIVLTATLHMPFPHLPMASADLDAAERKRRDLRWNPQRHLSEDASRQPETRRLVNEKAQLLSDEPSGKRERKEWFRRLRALTEQLRPLVAEQYAQAEREVEVRRIEAQANEILTRRDYPWCLFPEDVLRDFCRKLL